LRRKGRGGGGAKHPGGKKSCGKFERNRAGGGANLRLVDPSEKGSRTHPKGERKGATAEDTRRDGKKRGAGEPGEKKFFLGGGTLFAQRKTPPERKMDDKTGGGHIKEIFVKKKRTTDMRKF